MEPELRYETALRAARDAVQSALVQGMTIEPVGGIHLDLADYNAALAAYEALAKAVGAAAMPCIGAHPYNAGYLRCAEYIAAQVSEEDQARARRGRCFSCEARAEADRLAAPYLPEVKA